MVGVGGVVVVVLVWLLYGDEWYGCMGGIKGEGVVVVVWIG